ncbi:MAG: SDR family oxidoreductase [Opitutus sp.]|nr:SDR family oxidoreductase [Opitutus sp.]
MPKKSKSTPSVSKHFKGKVVLVTGGASGIGLAIATRFAAEGAKVVISDVQAEVGTREARRLKGLFVPADLSRRGDCQALIEQIKKQCGTLHILINCAGFQYIAPLDEFDEDRWEKMIAVMLTAPFLLTKYIWPTLKAQKWGRVINIGSVLSVRGVEFKAGYVSAKHGLLGLTQTTALEGGQYNITAHCICPAYVRTPLMENQIAAQARTRGISESEVVEKVMLKGTAIKRLIEPSEIAAMVVYLSREDSVVTTGSSIMMDLGVTAGH